MKMDLLDFYRSLLATAGMTVVDEDYISLLAGKDRIPALVNDKRLVLPTPRQLRSPDFENRVVFHPMNENIMHGESDVMAFFRECFNARLNVVVSMLMLELTQIATSTKNHALLNPDQAEYLSLMKEADEDTFTRVSKLVDAIDGSDPRRAAVWIFLKRSITIQGRKHSRGSVVSFPLYEEILRAEKTSDKNRPVFGVGMRVKDLHVLKALLQFMIPNIDRPEMHLYGTDSTTAPFLESLLHAVKFVAAPLNDMVALFENQLVNPEKLQSEAGWVEVLDNLSVLREQAKAIPMQAGNEGATEEQTPAAVAAQARQPVGPTFSPTAQQPVHQMAAPGFRQPMAVSPQAQQAGQAPAQIVKTSGGIDFNSVLQSNPVLNYVVSANAGMMMPGLNPQQMMMNRQPRWAQPGNPMYSSGMPVQQMMPQGQILTGGAYPGQGYAQPVMQPVNTGFGMGNRGFGSGI